jgi:hypothetical protein
VTGSSLPGADALKRLRGPRRGSTTVDQHLAKNPFTLKPSKVTMHNWPQIVWLMLVALSSLKAWVRLGEPKKPDTYDAGDVLIGPAFACWLLYEGGFFAPLGYVP